MRGQAPDVKTEPAITLQIEKIARLQGKRPNAEHRLASPACGWPWRVAPVLGRICNFRAILGQDFDEALTYAAVRKAETIGRPIG